MKSQLLPLLPTKQILKNVAYALLEWDSYYRTSGLSQISHLGRSGIGPFFLWGQTPHGR